MKPSPRLRTAAAALMLALVAAGSASAQAFDCAVRSDYDIEFDAGDLRFERIDGSPARVELRAGRLLVDGAPVQLSEADAARVAAMLRELRALAPEVLAIALEAVDIAFEVLSDLATGLLDEPGPTRERLAQAHLRIAAELRAAPIGRLDDRRFERVVEQTVAELVPLLVADVVRAALAGAFSADPGRASRLEARVARLEQDIEQRVEPRAEALEARARELCDRIVALDAVEDGLDYRLPDGRRLELLRSGPE